MSEEQSGENFDPIIDTQSSDANVKIKTVRNGDFYESIIRFTKESLAIPIEIQITEGLPDNYQFQPLEYAYPSNIGGLDRELFIAPVNIDEDRIGLESRLLYGKNPLTMDVKTLYKFYQKSRALALHRMKDLRDTGRSLHDYDIQTVYKYLQAINQLSLNEYLLPPEDVSSVVTWLKEVRDENPEKVKKALQRLVNADQIIEQLDSNEALRIGRLWKFILKTDNQYLKYQLFRTFYNTYQTLSQETRAKILQSGIAGLSEQEIVNSLAQALNNSLSTDVSSFNNPIEDQKYVVNTIIQVLSRTDQNSEYYRRLSEARVVIQAYKF